MVDAGEVAPGHQGVGVERAWWRRHWSHRAAGPGGCGRLRTAASRRLTSRTVTDVLGDAYAGGQMFDFVCGDEVSGSCTELREFQRSGTHRET
jgi:hypothetical protein